LDGSYLYQDCGKDDKANPTELSCAKNSKGHPYISVGNFQPGSLVIFNGRDNLHRVSRVFGDIPRINVILTFENKSQKRSSAYTLEKFFGRKGLSNL